jgi:putative component of toxin-antitoxin plasmid stabilization module
MQPICALIQYRVDFSSGCRIYSGKDGERLVILLAGDTKKRKQCYIKAEYAQYEDYK